MSFDFQTQTSKKVLVRAKQRVQRNKLSSYDLAVGKDRDFICLHCHTFISGAAAVSGVRNRNHCPYCLHSRHLDLNRAGDRLAACKATMRPIGLTCKQSRNKYRQNGELMLIHLCDVCKKVSINRIAADDLKERIFAVFIQTYDLDPRIRFRLSLEGIHMLQASDRELVEASLNGKLASNSLECL